MNLLKNLRKSKILTFGFILQNFVYSVSPIPAFSILVINKQILTYLNIIVGYKLKVKVEVF